MPRLVRGRQRYSPFLVVCAALIVIAPARANAQNPSDSLRRGGYTEETAFNTLYVSFGMLQLLDAQSTSRAIDAGAYEANSVFRGIAHHPIALMGAKTAVAAGTIVLMERFRKKHPRAALVTMMAIDSAYAVIVVRNSRIAHQLRIR